MHSSVGQTVAACACREVCAGCQQPIADRYILRVMDDSWHEGCLQCCVCHAHLAHSCYAREHKLYCKTDYDNLFGVKCASCHVPIPPSELVMRAAERVFHLACFVCVVCGRRLQKGEQFVVRGGGQIFCRADFEKEMTALQHSPKSDGSGDDGGTLHTGKHCKGDGRRGPKRPRTILTTQQRRAFKASFEISSKPCRKVRESLAKETGLSVRIVQVWFQNQRAKMKKLQKKQNQENNGRTSDETRASTPHRGKNKKIKQEAVLSPYSSLTPPHLHESSTDSADYSVSGLTGEVYSEQATPHLFPSRDDVTAPMDSAAFYGKNDGGGNGNLDALEDVLIGSSPVPPLPASTNPLFVTPESQANPIDRLYSMHSSYFNSSDCDCAGATDT
uniref:Uncharacterized protein n=1 Tax=Strigamia maritima TaxID=126957 RepID=T1IJ58_STRMM